MTKKEKTKKHFDEAFKAHKIGDYNIAKIGYEKAIELDTNYLDAYNNYANLLWKNFNNYNKAREYYEKAIKINSNYFNAYINLASLLKNHFQEYEKAKQCYEKAIEINQNYAGAYNNLALIIVDYFQEYEKAKQYYDKAIEINPNYAEAYNNLANLLYKHFKEYDKAKQYYEKAIDINPNFAETYNNLAVLLEDYFQEYEKAEQYYSKYILLSNSKIVKKVTQINLNDYNQFERNTKIDLTYPKGHPKAGQPLDKVCFIGQSGTGKTSILELIKGLYTNKKANIPNADFNSVYLKYNFYDFENKISLINFPAHSVENIKKLNKNDILNYEFKEIPLVVDFEKSDPKEHWCPILHNITEYKKKIYSRREDIALKIENISGFDDDLQKYINKFEADIIEFKNDDKNPLKQLSIFLKPLLSKFNLDINKVPSSKDDIEFIPIIGISNEDGKEKRENIQTQFLSTGTKEILSRTVPLFALKPRNTIILIDEPENSLYPNVQKEFIDFITKESWNNIKTCQFFFATHSPTIASSFDPWEIIELKFNDDGKVEQKLYYEGERHVDNFTIHPKYLRWDDILINLFDTKFEGDEERNNKLQELSILERDIEIGVYKGEAKKNMIEKYLKIASQLKWELNN